MKLRNIFFSVALTIAALPGAACGSDGVPGIEGTIELSSDILLNTNARQIFVGAYGAEQLRSDGWPTRWTDAKFSTLISDPRSQTDFSYSFITGSSERLYVYAFLDQNGLAENFANTEPNVVETNGDEIADVIGRYPSNPVVPIDDMLKSIDIVITTPVLP